jgi:chaperonin GroES
MNDQAAGRAENKVREDSITMSTATKKQSRVKLQPLGDRVVVRREDAEAVTAGGIVLPDSAQERPARGTIVSVGDGILMPSGERLPLQVKPGDNVIFSSFAGEAIEVDEDEVLLMRESDILAVVES